MIEPLLAPHNTLVCHLRTHHVDLHQCMPDWRLNEHVREEEEKGFSIAADELLLLGRDPQIAHIRDTGTRSELEALLDDGRRLRLKKLAVAPETSVSATQVAVWFARNQLMAASVGTNTVETQRWGLGRTRLAGWPGEAVGQLATLWLPLSSISGENMRWRISLAFTGPDELVSRGISAVGEAAFTPTGFTAGAELSELQRNVVVERFRQWLSFPASTYSPKTARVEGSRPGEHTPKGTGNAAERADTRLGRLKATRRQLERNGFTGPFGPDFLRALVEQNTLRPDELRGYDEVDLKLLDDLGLLPRS